MKTSISFTPFFLVYGKEALLPIEVELPSVKMLEKFLGNTNDAFKKRLLYLQRVKLDRMSTLEHYEKMRGQTLEKMNKKVKDKGIKEGNLVLRYNSKLDNTFQKKFQVKWEGPFKVVSCFTNGTYQLANLDGTLHASRVNGLRLKPYHARLMIVEKDEENEEDESVPARNASLFGEEGVQMLFVAADHE